MILYLDSSALVKKYVLEAGSEEVRRSIEESEGVGTVVLAHTEVVAALAKAVRTGVLTKAAAKVARTQFEGDWPDLIRLAVAEPTATRAADLAWSHDLRGYDALHLAAARTWADLMDEALTFATYDRRLWTAAGAEGLHCWPEDLPAVLDSWAR